jgi:hypothetical protein
MDHYMLSEWTVPKALTPNRVEWLKFVLANYGVSVAGAEQFTASNIVTDSRDRRSLLDILNRVVEEGSPNQQQGFRGKG